MNTNNIQIPIDRSTTSIVFVPGTTNSIAHNTYDIDVLKINLDVVDAKALYKWLKHHYEFANDDRSYACESKLF